MSIVKYHASSEVVVYQQNYEEEPTTTLALYRGIPNFSHAFNTFFINETYGNSLLENANVICLSDYHCDPFQKHIRAYVINKLFHEITYLDNIIFLVEGTHYGRAARICDVDDLIGLNLINNSFDVAGWDNRKLLLKGIKVIQELQEVCSAYKRAAKKIHSLQNLRYQLSMDFTIPAKKFFLLQDKVEQMIEDEQADFGKLAEKVCALVAKVDYLAKRRNESLYNAIHTVHSMYPDTKIVVIAGGNHFDGISEELGDIKHAVVQLRNTKEMGDIDEELKEYYCKPKVKPIGFIARKMIR